VARRQDGFTLIELLIVVVIIAILLAAAITFHGRARGQASDAIARSNIRTALPAVESYRGEIGSYAGMTLPILQSSYSPGVQGIEVLSADDLGYCLRSTVNGHSWYKNGPAGAITTTACP
jgi:prepilin-type N-terminal cleavage/methylation domain-containing protein